MFSWKRPLPRPSWRRKSKAGAKSDPRRQLRQEVLEPRLPLDSTVVFNEVYYHPASNQPADLEWIELHNQMSVNMDISGWSLSDGVSFTFPEGTVVPGRGYLVVASDPAKLANVTSYDQALGPMNGKLSNGGERLELSNRNGRRMSVVEYDDEEPWPIGADGSGFSLAKLVDNTASNEADNWAISTQRNGTPGTANFPIARLITDEFVSGESIASYSVPADQSGDDQWTSANFDDSAWATGPSSLGFDSHRPEIESLAPPNDGLRFWLDATDLNGDGIKNNPTVGDEVLKWRDKVLGLEFEPVDTRPQLSSLGPLGTAAVRFSGSDVLQERDLKNADFLSNSRGSITMVYTNENGQIGNEAGGYGLLAGRLGNLMGTIVLEDDQLKSGFAMHTQGRANNLVAGVPSAVNDGEPHWSTITADGRQWQFFTDSAGPLPTGQTTSGDNKGVWFNVNSSYSELTLGAFVGRDGTPRARRWVGDIAEVLIYEDVLTEAKRKEIDDYIWEKYLEPTVSTLVTTDIQDAIYQVNSTLYLRNEFNVADPAGVQSLLLDVTYNDGFVAYVNGQEVARRNAPELVDWNSSATARADETMAHTTVDITFAKDHLIEGKNVLAVHGLNVSPSDEDFLVVPNLTAFRLPINENAAPEIVINELPPSGTTDFWVELKNQSDKNINLDELKLEIDGQDFALGDSEIAPGAQHVVMLDGARVNNADQLVLYSSTKDNFVDATRVSRRLRGRSDQHQGQWLYPKSATPGAPNQFDFVDDLVINEIMYHAAPNSPIADAPPTYSRNNLVPFDASWRYNATGADLGKNWAEQTYTVDNTNWLEGQSGIGFLRTPLSIPIRTELTRPLHNNPRFETYYLQTDFEFSPNDLHETFLLQLRHLVDDAAAFYLNGVEVYRYNLPVGELTAKTRAVNSVNDAQVSPSIKIDSQLLRPGTNVLSVELHLRSRSSRAVFFAAELALLEEQTPLIPGRPFSENNDEWIELFNRGSATIDLTGWTLRDAIDYEFDAGTKIARGEYVVIANDAAAFAAAHPDVRVLGSFERSLSNSNDRIILRDAHDNPADAVHYFDGGRWPKLADGRGSSLELKDADADNTRAEAWQPSDESDRSEWHTYTIRRTAQQDTGPDDWNEFVFGMLRDGTVLIDDISATRITKIFDPQDGPTDLIQNGDFENDTVGEAPEKWRIVGNHHGTVVTDPQQPQNRVLLLDATGPTHHEHNHASTTLADNTPIVDGEEYEIKFRAKWLRGGNQLLSRFYVNRVAATSIIETPTHNGTPGRSNSQSIPNAGPTYVSLSHTPVVPLPYQDVTVSIQADDPDGIHSVTLWWSVDGAPFTSVPMLEDAGLYRVILPGQQAGTVVQFYVEGQDDHSATSYFPAAGPDSRALFQVQDNRGTTNPIDNIRIIMHRKDTDRIFTPTQFMSNQLEGATVIVNDHNVFYDIGVRAKGGSRGRPFPSHWGSYNLRFHPDQLFRGVHDAIGLDKSGKAAREQEEILFDHISNHAAGGLLSHYTDLAYSVGSVPEHDGTVILELARYDSTYLDERFENGENATVFEHGLIYYPTQTIDGTPEGLKTAAPNEVLGVPSDDYGNDKEFYRWNLLIKNNRVRDDYDRVIEMNKVLGLRDDAFLDAVEDVIDVDQWLRTFAVAHLAGVHDSYFRLDWQHNTGLIVPPSDRGILLVPWDADVVFDQGFGLFTSNPQFKGLMESPEYERTFYGHLHDILNTTFNVEYLAPWADHYGKLVNQDLSRMSGLIAANTADALGEIGRRAPTVEFAVTDALPSDTQPESMMTLTGTAWINVRQIQLVDSDLPLDVTWTDVTTWKIDVPVLPGVTELIVEAYDFQGAQIGVNAIAVTPPPVTGDLTGDGILNVGDIELLNARIHSGSNDANFDLDENGQVNRADVDVLFRLLGTTYGDTNLDGVFDSDDLVQMLATGKYEDSTDSNSGWADGDFDGDGDFTSEDLVIAFQFGHYQF